MDNRYAVQEITYLREPDYRYRLYHEILTRLAVERGAAGIIPPRVWERIVIAPIPKHSEVTLRELTTKHDVAAFVDLYEAGIDEDVRRFVYWGLTSSDLVDTAQGATLKRAWEFLVSWAEDVCYCCNDRSGALFGQLRPGRTHGQRAYPVPQYDLFARLERGVAWLLDHRHPEFYGKLSGPTGQHNGPNSAQVEGAVLDYFGLRVDMVATQITSRLHVCDFAMLLVQLVSCCEAFATQVRLRSQEGIREVAEGFAEGQKGSSSMPDKRNPIQAERLCGLARVARGYLHPVLETNGVLWDHRDISNSSVERIALWDLVELTGFILKETIELVRTLNLGSYTGSVHNEVLDWVPSADRLNERIEYGVSRNEAYAELRGQERERTSVSARPGEQAGSTGREEPAGDPANPEGSGLL